jgi:CubicO group peptidase (beta-lactamase class C family)
MSRRELVTATLAASIPWALSGCTTRRGPGGTGAAPRPRPAATPSSEDWRSYGEQLAGLAAAGRFSGAVLVSREGEPLLREGYGMADRRDGVANRVGTRFCACSMGKMFTAVAVAQLVEQGRLSFADTIAPYVSDYGFPPEVAGKITIAQLLTHTAGTGDALRRTPTYQPPDTIAGLMRVIAATPLLFPPGSRFGYSNSGYVILGAVIENIVGQAYAAHLRQHVFAPAGMTDTDVRTYRPVDVPGMAHPYALLGPDGQPVGPAAPGSTVASGALRDVGDMPQIGNPSGGAYTTVGDLDHFARALVEHRLLGPAMTTTVLAGKVATNDPARPVGDRYAYGFDDLTVGGVRIVGHNGGSPGYEGQLQIYPDKGYVVAILTNQDGVLAPAAHAAQDLLTR